MHDPVTVPAAPWKVILGSLLVTAHAPACWSCFVDILSRAQRLCYERLSLVGAQDCFRAKVNGCALHVGQAGA
ncbi:MAG: hypothetical protein B7Z20_04365 [Sphingobium sp. 32-64-5]|nr:MAG: hypothetical protein B7Z20_04365 [Sphingobium sp. 32-64-5]